MNTHLFSLLQLHRSFHDCQGRHETPRVWLALQRGSVPRPIASIVTLFVLLIVFAQLASSPVHAQPPHTHRVTLSSLGPETTYYVSGVSRDATDDGQLYQVTTGPTLDIIRVVAGDG